MNNSNQMSLPERVAMKKFVKGILDNPDETGAEEVFLELSKETGKTVEQIKLELLGFRMAEVLEFLALIKGN